MIVTTSKFPLHIVLVRRETAQISCGNFPNNMAYQILTWTLTPPQKDDGRIRVRQCYYLLIGQLPINQINSKELVRVETRLR